MIGFIRYQYISYLRSLKIIPPITVFAAWVGILYAYKHVPILSSYAVTSMAIYLIMTWVAMGIFSIEEESEKHILLVQLGSKLRFILGKWIVCLGVTFLLMLFAILFPILDHNFIGSVKPIHLGLTLYSHFFLAILGILVGTLFSITSFASRKYAWLSAVLVIVISIAYEGLTHKLALLKWPLLLFPPVVKVIKYLSGDDQVTLGSDFLLSTVFILVYILLAAAVVTLLFLRKER